MAEGYWQATAGPTAARPEEKVTLELTRKEFFAVMLSVQLDLQRHGPYLEPGVAESVNQKLEAAEKQLVEAPARSRGLKL